MAVFNGQLANETTFNNAFGSKQNNNSWDGVQTFSNTSESTSTVTGAIICSGGLGLAKNLYVGGAFNLTGAASILDGTDSSSSITGSIVTNGGLGVGKNIYAGGNGVFTGTLGASNLSGTNTGDVSIGTFDNTPSAQGIAVSGSQVLTLHAASATVPGAVSIGVQAFGGNKTFNNDLAVLGSFTFSGKTLANTPPTDGQLLRYDALADTWVKVGSGGADTNTAVEAVTTTITKLAAGYKMQHLRVQGNGGAQVLSNTPLGSLSGYASGTVFIIEGNSDTNTVRVNNADVAGGALLNGDALLGDCDILTLIYNATRDRLIEVSRNFE